MWGGRARRRCEERVSNRCSSKHETKSVCVARGADRNDVLHVAFCDGGEEFEGCLLDCMVAGKVVHEKEGEVDEPGFADASLDG